MTAKKIRPWRPSEEWFEKSGTLPCGKCMTILPKSDFAKDKTHKNGYRSICKECTNKSAKATWKKNKHKYVETSREWYLQKKYGISIAEYNQILDEQNGVCKICDQPEVKKDRHTSETVRLAVDHCHTTGKVRGLLCVRCNLGIGRFEDNPELLRSAARYLEDSVTVSVTKPSWVVS